MLDRQTLQNLSPTGQALLDIDQDVIEELVELIKFSGIAYFSSPLFIFTELSETLSLFKIKHPDTAIVHFSYRLGVEAVNVKIFREVISLTIDDVKLLALMPTV
jgi:hypothetical protein